MQNNKTMETCQIGQAEIICDVEVVLAVKSEVALDKLEQELSEFFAEHGARITNDLKIRPAY